MIVRETYDMVKLPVAKRFKCRCGKRVVRKTTLWQTVNPYNRDSSGRPKTREQIRAELLRDSRKWMESTVASRSCEEGEAR